MEVGVARIGICFVCSANICRSPTAEGIMKHLVEEAYLGDRLRIESAGTSAHFEGGPRDRRSESTANSRGISLEGRARQFRCEDFARFDYVLAMDERNRADLLALAECPEDRAKVALLRDFEANASEASVPDPYMGGARGFDEVFELCEAACRGLMAELLERLGVR
jgi:protein-tyrosine phosphatase